MSQGFVLFPLGDDSSMKVVAVASNNIEAETDDQASVVRTGRGQRLEAEVKKKFVEAVGEIVPIANKVLDQVRAIGDAVTEVQVDFGVKLNAKWGVVIVGGAEADLKVSLKWKREATKQPETPTSQSETATSSAHAPQPTPEGK